MGIQQAVNPGVSMDYPIGFSQFFHILPVIGLFQILQVHSFFIVWRCWTIIKSFLKSDVFLIFSSSPTILIYLCRT